MSDFTKQKYVGRVDVSDYKNGRPFHLHQDHGVGHNSDFRNTLHHYHEETSVSRYFFSRDNIDLLQKAIVFNVNKRLRNENIDVQIGKQSEDNLHVVMRAMYLQEGRNVDCRLKEQIKMLNGKVLEFVIPNIITNVRQYAGYIKDISNPVPTIPRPIDVSSRRNNSEMQPDVGFVCFSDK